MKSRLVDFDDVYEKKRVTYNLADFFSISIVVVRHKEEEAADSKVIERAKKAISSLLEPAITEDFFSVLGDMGEWTVEKED